MSESKFPDIEKLQKQTFQKYNQDGITELLLGVVLYMLALVYQNVAFIGVSASFVVFGPTVVLKLRNKYIYPRLGYAKVKFFPVTTRRAIILALIFCWTFVIEILSMYFIENTISNFAIWQKWLPIFFSSVILVYSLEMIRHSGNMKYILIYILALSWGIFISLTPLGMTDPIDHFAIYSLLMGLFWSIFGGIRLKNFIKKNPILQEQGEYNSGEKKEEE